MIHISRDLKVCMDYTDLYQIIGLYRFIGLYRIIEFYRINRFSPCFFFIIDIIEWPKKIRLSALISCTVQRGRPELCSNRPPLVQFSQAQQFLLICSLWAASHVNCHCSAWNPQLLQSIPVQRLLIHTYDCNCDGVQQCCTVSSFYLCMSTNPDQQPRTQFPLAS